MEIKVGIYPTLYCPDGPAAAGAQALLALSPAAGAQALQIFLPVQYHVGETPQVVPVSHLPGPRLGGQSAKGPQHFPAQPVSAVRGYFFFTCSACSRLRVRGGFSSRLNWLQVRARAEISSTRSPESTASPLEKTGSPS